MPKLRDPKPMSSFNPSRAALLHERLHVQIMVRDPSVLRIGDARPRHTTKAFTGMATSSMDGRLVARAGEYYEAPLDRSP